MIHHVQLRHSILAGSALAALALTACSSSTTDDPSSTAASTATETAESTSPAHFSYEGAEGPEFWADLDSTYATCGSGTEQSPVDLPSTVPAEEDAVTIAALDSTGDVADTGHSFQFTPDDGGLSTLTFDGTDYSGVQMHYHTPSEHTVDGEHADAELHVVHSTDDGDLLVFGLLVNEGEENEALAPFIDAIAADEKGAEEAAAELDIASLLPDAYDLYTYSGSLTTPPCTEGVQWVIVSTPIEISAEQLAVLEAGEGENNRPVQDLNDRIISGGLLSASA